MGGKESTPAGVWEPVGCGGTWRHRILCYGDDGTAGVALDGAPCPPYSAALAEALGEMGAPTEVLHCGLVGLTAREISRRISDRSIIDALGRVGKGLGRILEGGTHFDLVLVMVGTHDLGRGTHPDAILNYVAGLHCECHQRGLPTLALVPPQAASGARGTARAKLAKVFGSWARATPGVLCLDPEVLVPRRTSEAWEADGVHFTPAGLQELGRSLAPAALLRLEGARSRPISRLSPTCEGARPAALGRCSSGLSANRADDWEGHTASHGHMRSPPR